MRTAELPRLEVVYVKELASAAGVCEHTILRRLRLWDADPNNAQAIPYLRHLGKPYRISRTVAQRVLAVAEGVNA